MCVFTNEPKPRLYSHTDLYMYVCMYIPADVRMGIQRMLLLRLARILTYHVFVDRCRYVCTCYNAVDVSFVHVVSS